MNKIKSIILLIIFAILLVVAPIFKGQEENNKTESITVQEEATAEPVDIVKEVNEEEIIKEKLDALYDIDDKKERLLTYKKILEEHPSIIDGQETIYESFKKEEINLLHRVVQAEIGVGDFDAKVNVANTILNRFYGGGFGDTLSEILNPWQFATIANGAHKKVTISDDTVWACEYCFLFEDTVNGAVFFESLDSNVHSSYAKEVLNDGYHKFYK